MPAPPYSMYKTVEKAVRKAMSRRVRKGIAQVSQQVAQSGQDPLVWASAARQSCDRMALIGAGDAGEVIDQIIGPPGSPERLAMKDNDRARALLSFAVSDEFLNLRRQLGMGVS